VTRVSVLRAHKSNGPCFLVSTGIREDNNKIRKNINARSEKLIRRGYLDGTMSIRQGSSIERGSSVVRESPVVRGSRKGSHILEGGKLTPDLRGSSKSLGGPFSALGIF